MGVAQRRMFLKRKRTGEGKAGGQVFLFALRPSPRPLRPGSRVGGGVQGEVLFLASQPRCDSIYLLAQSLHGITRTTFSTLGAALGCSRHRDTVKSKVGMFAALMELTALLGRNRR